MLGGAMEEEIKLQRFEVASSQPTLMNYIHLHIVRNKTQESYSKANSFIPAEGSATNIGLASKHMGRESTRVFIPITTLTPLLSWREKTSYLLQ
jgi:hypothetical protein